MSTIYFVTFVTSKRVPFFTEELFANALCDTMVLACRLKKFRLLGYKINPEHIHLLIEKLGKFYLKDVMHSIKRNSSININKLIRAPGSLAEHETEIMGQRYHCMILKNGPNNLHEYPLFRWQPSFHVRRVDSHRHYIRCREYLKKQYIKHALNEDLFLFLSDVEVAFGREA